MLLNRLKELVMFYDCYKGWGRRIFGDASQIRALKSFISFVECTLVSVDNVNPNVYYHDFQQFLLREKWQIDLSDKYIATRRASTTIFKIWQDEFIDIGSPISSFSNFDSVEFKSALSYDSN